MTKRRIIKSGCLLLLALLVAVGWLIFLQKPGIDPRQLQAAYLKEAQRLYRHEILSLYQPPQEAFTPNGINILKRIQQRYSPVFLPYLVMGATPVQPDVLYNPWFDVFVLIEGSEGLINSVVLASSLGAGQIPQLQVERDFWREIHRRHQIAKVATFSNPRLFDGTPQVLLEMRNLTNHYHWPSRIRLTDAKVSFDLYIQRRNQAIYCSPLEPGTFVVFNVADERLRTNVIALPPYSTKTVERAIQGKSLAKAHPPGE